MHDKTKVLKQRIQVGTLGRIKRQSALERVRSEQQKEVKPKPKAAMQINTRARMSAVKGVENRATIMVQIDITKVQSRKDPSWALHSAETLNWSGNRVFEWLATYATEKSSVTNA